MKKATSLVAWTLFFVSVAGFAQPPSQPPLTSAALAAILGEPEVSRSCGGQKSGLLFAASPLGKSTCSAEAFCISGASVFCQGSTSCTAVDYNCSIGEPGHVTCDGVDIYCANCCVGTIQQRTCCRCAETGDCFDCCRCNGGGPGECALRCG
jgi:hypothetical protein